VPVGFGLLRVLGDNRLEPLVLSETERQVLSNWVRRRTTAQGADLARLRPAAVADRDVQSLPGPVPDRSVTLSVTKLSAQHRAVDFRDFLDEVDHQTDKGLAVHVICENLSAHKAPAVHKWLLAHPRLQLHFTPTYPSWIN